MEIAFHDVHFSYHPQTPMEIKVLEGITARMAPGEAVGILGRAGAGKTTLVKLLNGLRVPTRGSVLVDGIPTVEHGPELRRRVGVVFQRPERQLIEPTVWEDFSFALRRAGGLSGPDIDARVRWAGRQLGLDVDRIRDDAPSGLAPADRRRVAIAGTLVNYPECLVLDEPAVGLDPRSCVDLCRFLRSWKETQRNNLVIVSHDMTPFLPFLDTLGLIERGRVIAWDTPEAVCSKVFDDPDRRAMTPDLAVLVEALRRRGWDLRAAEYHPARLAERIMELKREKRIQS